MSKMRDSSFLNFEDPMEYGTGRLIWNTKIKLLKD